MGICYASKKNNKVRPLNTSDDVITPTKKPNNKNSTENQQVKFEAVEPPSQSKDKEESPALLHVSKAESVEDDNKSNSGMKGKTSSSKKNLKKKIRKKEIRETSDIRKTTTEEGIKMVNNYEIREVLGEGSFGKVRLAVKKWEGFEQKYALKIFKKAKLKRKRELRRDANGKLSYKDALEDVMREIIIMKKISHPNCLRLHEVLHDAEKDKLYLVLDYAAGGQLIEWNEDDSVFYFCKEDRVEKTIPEKELRRVFRDCVKGLAYLHSNGIIHRDLKPQNILFDSLEGDVIGNPKIADFGVAAITQGDDKLITTEGTYYFMAPELCDHKVTTEGGFSGKLADVWALGVTFWAFTFLEVPFIADDVMGIMEAIKKSGLKFPESRQISASLKDLFLKMMEKDPQKRITLKEIAAHPWINEGEDDDLSTLIMEGDKIQVADEDFDEVIIPLNRVFFMKTVAKKWKSSAKAQSERRRSSIGPISDGLQPAENTNNPYRKSITIKDK